VELSNYLYVVKKRLWIIVLTTVITVAVVVAGASQAAPLYEATTTLRIIPFGLNTPDYGIYVYFDRLANTYSSILESDVVAGDAKQILGLPTLPDFQIEIVPQTELMKLTVTDTDPQRAQNVATTLAQLLISANQSAYLSGGLPEMLRDRLDDIEAQIETLTQEQEQLDSQTFLDAEAEAHLAEINRQIRSQQQTYDLVTTSYNQAVISQLTLASALSMVDPAPLPEAPTGRGIVQTAAIAGAVGLMGGIVLAFFLESRKLRFYTDEQAAVATQVPVIGKVPTIRKRYRDNLLSTDPVTAEAFRRLRTNIFKDIRVTPLRTLIVASALPQEGKTTVAANLALSVASIGRKVLLIDADLYQARLSRRYHAPVTTGLSDIIQKKKSLQEGVQPTQNPNLSLLTIGNRTTNAAEMLGSFDFEPFIEQLLQSYDVIIFDTPPLLATTDSLIIAPYVDGVLWVMDRARTEQKDILEAHQQLHNRGTNVVGIVMNRVRKDKSFHLYRHYAELPALKPVNGAGKLPIKEIEPSKN
jgi:capsular exopolysaccharide synthesis family protein